MSDNAPNEVRLSQPENSKVSRSVAQSAPKDPHAQNMALEITHDRAQGVIPVTTLQKVRDYVGVDLGGGVGMEEHSLSGVGAGSKRDILTQKEEQGFTYKGVRIEGIGRLEEQKIVTRDEVVQLLDRLPEEYFEHFPISTIVFEPYKYFSVQRDGKVAYVRGDSLLSTDKIIARKKGEMTWNSHEKDGVEQISDGKMTIHVYSPENWDDKNDKQADKEIALTTIAHEIGHVTWGGVVIGPHDLWEPMRSKGLPAPASHPNLKSLQTVIDIWRSLPESTLERFLEYRKVFEQDAKIDRSSEKEVKEIFHEEDFAIAHEYYLYWQNLQGKDSARADWLDTLYEITSEPSITPKE